MIDSVCQQLFVIVESWKNWVCNVSTIKMLINTVLVIVCCEHIPGWQIYGQVLWKGDLWSEGPIYM